MSSETDGQNLFMAFLQSPDKDSYLAVRNWIVESDLYDPYADDLDEIHDLLDEGKFAAAGDEIGKWTPTLLLNPTVHWMLSMIEGETGNEQDSRMEAFIAAKCVEALVATGDGTAEHPYLVMTVGDEYDIMEFLGKEFAGQSVIGGGDPQIDVITCSDGVVLRFDTTDLRLEFLRKMQRARFREQG